MSIKTYFYFVIISFPNSFYNIDFRKLLNIYMYYYVFFIHITCTIYFYTLKFLPN